MKLLKACNIVLHRVILLLMVSALLLSGYVLWSNHRTYANAEDVFNDLLLFKPTEENADGGYSFEELKKINPDVCAWLTVDGTKIDYPVLQGDNNLSYMNKDVFGQTSLAGSIFLDTRNSKDFSDPYSIIYGHHMDNSLMFGDLDLFRDEEFFNEHRTAYITTEKGKIEYQILSAMDIQDSVKEIFDPAHWGGDLTALADYIDGHSIHIWQPSMEYFRSNPTMIRVVSLVTCASGHTGVRTVLVLITKSDSENKDGPGGKEADGNKTPVAPPSQTGDSILNSPLFWIIVLIVSSVSLCAALAVYIIKRKRKKEASGDAE